MKRPGRVGDSPLIGAGGYADSAVGGCSTTGHGEAIMRTMLAAKAVAELDAAAYNGDVSAAAKNALLQMWTRVEGRGGAIMIDSSGNVGRYHTSCAQLFLLFFFLGVFFFANHLSKKERLNAMQMNVLQTLVQTKQAKPNCSIVCMSLCCCV